MHYGFEWNYCGAEIVLAVVDQPDIETDPRYLWREMLGLMQHLQRLRPLPAPHVDDAEVCIRAG